ncbi:MAG: M23 family metallopeptidase [Bacteroidota bacterium]
MTKTRILYAAVIILVIVILVYTLSTSLPRHFSIPIHGEITSGFGPRSAPKPGASTDHLAIDISTPVNTPVPAKFKGKVISRYYTSNGGNQLIVEHNGGWRSGYAHLNAYGKFKEGDTFNAGDIIAYTGNTGITTNPHLHYTLTTPAGVKVDPLLYVGKNLV